MRPALGFPQHIYVAVTGYIPFGRMGSWNSISSMRPVPTYPQLCSENKNAPDSIRAVGLSFWWLLPPELPAAFQTPFRLAWLPESRISSDFSAICAPITGNRALGHSIYEVVRRGVKRRFSFVALLFVFGTGAG